MVFSEDRHDKGEYGPIYRAGCFFGTITRLPVEFNAWPKKRLSELWAALSSPSPIEGSAGCMQIREWRLTEKLNRRAAGPMLTCHCLPSIGGRRPCAAVGGFR
jgi:hypothetical protein